MPGPAAHAALRDKELMFVCIRTAQEKIRTLYKSILPGRRCIIICHDDVRAEGLVISLNDIHTEAKKGDRLAMFVDGSSPVPVGMPCLVVSATGAALTEEEAIGFDTFVMHDNPTSKEQYKNWVWHSHCPAVISFLVDDPEEQNIQENYLLDQVETAFGVQLKELMLDSGKRTSKKSGKERDGDRERSKQKHREERVLARVEERHREETDKLTQLLQSLLVHQQVQVQQYQLQQQEQRSELEQQIKQLQTLLAQQQQHMEQQQQVIEEKLKGTLDSKGSSGQLPTQDPRLPATPLPTVQQFTSADPMRQALLLQQLQQYAQHMQVVQQAAYHGTPQYFRTAAPPPPPAVPSPPSYPPPPSMAQSGGRGPGKGRGQGRGGGKGQPRWMAASNVHSNNPFGQASGPSATQSSVQELARVDEELQALKSQLAQRQGQVAPSQDAPAEQPYGIWVPGKGYTGSQDQRPPPSHTVPHGLEVREIDAPAPEEWSTTERWDENAASY